MYREASGWVDVLMTLRTCRTSLPIASVFSVNGKHSSQLKVKTGICVRSVRTEYGSESIKWSSGRMNRLRKCSVIAELHQGPLDIHISICVYIMYMSELYFVRSLNCFKRMTNITGVIYSNHQEKKCWLVSTIE